MNLYAAMTTLVAKSGIPTVAPNMNDIPGGNAVQTVVNGVAGLALAGCTISLIYGAAQLGFNSNSGNSHAAGDGKKRIMWSIAGAAFILAAPTLLAWGADLGKNA